MGGVAENRLDLITGEGISVMVWLVNVLFTKFTILFTIRIPRAERHQSNFVV